MTSLDVYFHKDLVGHLERLPQARLRFAYESAWVEEEGRAAFARPPGTRGVLR